MPSSGSSSASYDPLKTPLDAYSGLEEGRLGDTFCVLKMKGAHGKKRKSFDRISDTDENDTSTLYHETEPVKHSKFLQLLPLLTKSEDDRSNSALTGLAFKHLTRPPT